MSALGMSAGGGWGRARRDRSYRSLEALKRTATTSRVLNLWQIANREAGNEEHEAKPFFTNRRLNRSIIVKHRVRPSEADLFPSPILNATKVMLPVTERDLRHGAHFLFVGQNNFDEVAANAFGDDLKIGARDRDVLELIGGLPSLDPFLMREILKTNGHAPAACYFAVSEADLQRMFDSARTELEPLVQMSFGGGDSVPVHSTTFLNKILSDANSAELEPLRRVMNMDSKQFREGVFCWKAFLYYKWQLQDLMPRIQGVLGDIDLARPAGPIDSEDKVYIARIKRELRGWITGAVQSVTDSLAVYDRAYAAMTRQNDPAAFREFLLSAPDMFVSLGERLSSIEHVCSFWRYRFGGDGQRTGVPADEFVEIFRDFEASLSTNGGGAQQW